MTTMRFTLWFCRLYGRKRCPGSERRLFLISIFFPIVTELINLRDQKRSVIVVDWSPTISCQPMVIGDWVTGQFYEASQPPKKSRLGTLIVPDKVLTEVLRHLRCSASFLSWNQILPKRKGPTDLQTLHSRNVMHQSRWGPCKMPCAVQCARCYMQYSTATHILY